MVLQGAVVVTTAAFAEYCRIYYLYENDDENGGDDDGGPDYWQQLLYYLCQNMWFMRCGGGEKG